MVRFLELYHLISMVHKLVCKISQKPKCFVFASTAFAKIDCSTLTTPGTSKHN